MWFLRFPPAWFWQKLEGWCSFAQGPLWPGSMRLSNSLFIFINLFKFPVSIVLSHTVYLVYLLYACLNSFRQLFIPLARYCMLHLLHALQCHTHLYSRSILTQVTMLTHNIIPSTQPSWVNVTVNWLAKHMWPCRGLERRNIFKVSPCSALVILLLLLYNWGVTVILNLIQLQHPCSYVLLEDRNLSFFWLTLLCCTVCVIINC